MSFAWFYCGWIFKCVCVIEHGANVTCGANWFVKCSYLIQLLWNLTCSFITCNMIFWLLFDTFIIFHHCFRHMNTWCDNLCHTFGCCFCAFSFTCHLISSGPKFFAWGLCLTCWYHIKNFMIIGFISVLMWILYLWCPIVIILCAFALSWLSDGLAFWFEFDPF